MATVIGLLVRNFLLWTCDLVRFTGKAFPVGFMALARHTTFPPCCWRQAACAGAQWQGESRAQAGRSWCWLRHTWSPSPACQLTPYSCQKYKYYQRVGARNLLPGGILSNFSKCGLGQPSPRLHTPVHSDDFAIGQQQCLRQEEFQLSSCFAAFIPLKG